MVRGCLVAVGVVALVVIGIVVYFAVRGVSDVNAASVNGAALATIRVGDTRQHVHQVLGKDGSDDTAAFGTGHPEPAGTTCRYFIAKSQIHVDRLPIHRLCFSKATDRVRSITVYPERT